MFVRNLTHHVPLGEEEVRADILEEVSESFLQPDVLPPHRRHQIPKPLQGDRKSFILNPLLLFHITVSRQMDRRVSPEGGPSPAGFGFSSGIALEAWSCVRGLRFISS